MKNKWVSFTRDSATWHFTIAEEKFHYEGDNQVFDSCEIVDEYDVYRGSLEPEIVKHFDYLIDHETLLMMIGV